MKNPLLCLALVFLFTTPLSAQPEFRAVWVATVFNLDWPSKRGLPAAEQKAQMIAMLDRAQQLKLNAILLQVRSMSDACYASKREPWSEFLGGKQGTDPGYDPLAFAIAEAHKRGLELHAWFNPFRAGTKSGGTYAANHITRTHPEWIRPYGTQLWVDPGEPDARRYILDTILDVVKRYDIDGVHIDDYFYPYPVKGADFSDDVSWRRYGANSGKTRGDWRRDNIDRFVEALYREVKAEKPSVRVGISPFGIWRPRVPATIEAQLDAYAQLYADARHWLSEGWCDYLSPQLYWGIEPAKQSFPVLLNWWREQSRAGRPVWPGIATERIGQARPAQEIAQQIALTRQGLPAGAAPGNIQWSMKALMRDQGGIDAVLQREVYGERARAAASPLIETMARELWHASLDEPCPYLPELAATTEYRILTEVMPDEHEQMIVRGWRRFGMQYFRPRCAQCQECVSLRVPIATFHPTKSQRRAWRKCGHLRVAIGLPQADEERCALFRTWHVMREETRGWKATTMSVREYALTFCTASPSAREMAYFEDERLVAIGLVDLTATALSSIYFFYHPDVREYSLGVASVLFEIEWARRLGRTHLYLGYRISGCPSTAYKGQYGPHELLEGRPDANEAPIWRSA